eukprot:tig00020961_g16685.t1
MAPKPAPPASDPERASDDEGEEEEAPRQGPAQIAYAIEPRSLHLLKRKFFPSKVGGKPAWLSPIGVPGRDALRCGSCQKPLTFLMQVYAPLDEETPEAFHRTLFIFCCMSGACLDMPGSIVALRSQLPRRNEHYGYDAPDENERGDGDDEVLLPSGPLCWLCGVPAGQRCGSCRAAHYCCREHQAEDWRVLHQAECRLIRSLAGGGAPAASAAATAEGAAEAMAALEVCGAAGAGPGAARQKVKRRAGRAGSLLRELELEMDEESEEEEEEEEAGEAGAGGAPAEASHEARLLREYNERRREEREAARAKKAAKAAKKGAKPKEQAEEEDEEESAEEEEEEGDEEKGGAGAVGEEDPAFAAFQRAVARHPRQVLRYAAGEGAAPLWVHPHRRCASADVPPCPRCGGPRSFEFQVMPQLLYYLRLDESAEAEAGAAATLDFGTLAVYTCRRTCELGGGPYAPEFVWRQPPVEACAPAKPAKAPKK